MIKAGGAEVVTCNLCLSEQLVGLAVKVVIQNDRDLLEAILLYQVEFSLFSSDESRGGTLKWAMTTFFPITDILTPYLA